MNDHFSFDWDDDCVVVRGAVPLAAMEQAMLMCAVLLHADPDECALGKPRAGACFTVERRSQR